MQVAGLSDAGMREEEGLAGTPFWDPGAFAGTPPTTSPDIWPAVRTALPEHGEALQPGLSEWEVVSFAGQRAPGICRVSGGRRRIVDPRWVPGSSGEVPVALFFAPAEYRVEILLWTPAQFAAFAQFVEFLFPKPTPASPPTPAQQFATPVIGPQAQSQFPNSPAQPILVPNSPLQAVDVEHPAFAALRVFSVYVVDIRAPEPGPIPQTMIAVIDCVEFRTPPNEGVKPFTSSVHEVSPGIYQPPTTTPSTRTPAPPGQTDIGATAGGPS